MLLLVGSGRALGTLWWLKPNTPLTVGRKGAPLLIDNDHSVSRKHATVTADTEDLSDISVLDNGSKFGVHINGRRCTAHSECRLGVGDRVTFGGQESTFELRCSPAAFCLANMRSDMITLSDSIYANAKALGIPIVSDIEQCTHVLVPKLEVTTKLVRALVFNRWIASPDYLSQLSALPATIKIEDPTAASVGEFIRNLQFFPTPQIPDMPTDSPVDLGDVKWQPDGRRQQLFADNIFAFSDAVQYDKYRTLIVTSGGLCTMLPGCDERHEPKWLSKKTLDAQAKAAADRMLDVCKGANDRTRVLPKTSSTYLVLPSTSTGNVIADSGFDVAAFVMRVARLLDTTPISESELGLAVLFIPCDEHSNPSISSRTPRDTDNSINDTSAGSDSLNESAPTKNSPIESECMPKKAIQEGHRKRARISSFWESAVSSSVLREDSTKGGPDPGPHTDANCMHDSGSIEASVGDVQPDQKSTSARRRRRGSDFWSGALKDNALSDPPSCVADSGNAAGVLDGALTISKNEEHADTVCKEEVLSKVHHPQAESATYSEVDAPEHDSNCGNQERKLTSGVTVQVVSLAKPKMPVTSHIAISHAGANFKRFKKTVHTYQRD
ncbi:hypothetical protein H4R24_003555 [Coemansia sp. RSA 988]|nr:hypothetical protein H4R24_003555 [Coemansia sp. RSA 988]